MKKFIIMSLLTGLVLSVHGQNEYRLWFDNQTGKALRGSVSPSVSTHLDLDVSELPLGVHQLFLALANSSGSIVSVKSSVFMKTEACQSLACRYWIDNLEPEALTTEESGNYHLNLDVSGLKQGIHTFNIVVLDDDGNLIDQQSASFVKMPRGGIVRYEYFVNGIETPLGGETLAEPTIPFMLLTDLDVCGATAAPLSSDNFHFYIDDGEPVVMAKNDIRFRFYLEDNTYIEDSTQYADLSASKPVVATKLESKVMKRCAVPEAESISWFKADSEAGDSVLFTVSAPSTMQLFAPDGTELMTTKGGQIRLHTDDTGAYYLAVYDADGNGTNQMDVYYECVESAANVADITARRPVNAPIYNMNGIRVASPTRKGIHIIGGRKQVVR